MVTVSSSPAILETVTWFVVMRSPSHSCRPVWIRNCVLERSASLLGANTSCCTPTPNVGRFTRSPGLGQGTRNCGGQIVRIQCGHSSVFVLSHGGHPEVTFFEEIAEGGGPSEGAGTIGLTGNIPAANSPGCVCALKTCTSCVRY